MLTLSAKAFTVQARADATALLQEQAVRLAAAAAQAVTGIVVTSQPEALHVAELLKQLKQGRTSLTAAQRKLTEPYQEAQAAVRGVLAPVLQEIERGITAGDHATRRYLRQQQEDAARERQRQQQESEAEAKRLAEAAALTGDDAPPPLSVMVPPPVRVLATSDRGMTYLQVRVEPAAIVSCQDCPPEWLKLDTAIARRDFLAAVARGEVAKPTATMPVLWRGVRFEGSESVVSR